MTLQTLRNTDELHDVLSEMPFACVEVTRTS